MSAFTGQTLGAVKQLTIAIFILAALAVSQPFLWGYVSQAAQTLYTRQTQETQLKEIEARIATVESNRFTQQALLDQLKVAFPSQVQTSQIVDRLEQLADRQNVALQIQSIAAENPEAVAKAKDKLSPLLVTVTVSGGATALLQYVAAVEHTQEVAVIRSWQMTAVASEGIAQPGAATYRLTMNIIFYLQRS